MTIDEAIQEFEALRNKKYLAKDLETIVKVVNDLEVKDFFIYAPPSKVAEQIRDVTDYVHIHPTMIVARKPYVGSIDRGNDPFPHFPHYLGLEGWVDHTSRNQTKFDIQHVLCPTSFVHVPVGSECGYCGEIHS
jgi:hypothetical protein